MPKIYYFLVHYVKLISSLLVSFWEEGPIELFLLLVKPLKTNPIIINDHKFSFTSLITKSLANSRFQLLLLPSYLATIYTQQSHTLTSLDFFRN